MSSEDIAVKVENLSKIYRIGLKDEMHDSLVRSVFAFMRKPLTNYKKYRSLYKFEDINSGQLGESRDSHSSIIWALKDISFEVKQGEVVGIIGRNGAGKSTLLKTLCKITDPTNGRATIRGRISSLLEVGTGFHQELTGRENVYLNGIILGMKKAEVDRKFDEIVAFSGVEKFIDTPVKRYSSGMKVRLAFSVAAHLEPEVLIIDEVLAVGDDEFQRKCISKMEDVGHQGRTVLFVSHNMPAVNRLCDRAILLESGGVVDDGPTKDVVKSFLTTNFECGAFRSWDEENAPRGDAVFLRSVKVHDENKNALPNVNIRNTFYITMEYEVIKPDRVLLPHFHFFNEEGLHAFVTLDKSKEWHNKPMPNGQFASTVKVNGNLLSEGIYYIHCNIVSLYPIEKQFSFPDAVSFQVYYDGKGGTARHDGYSNNLRGVVRPFLEWTTQNQ